MAQPRLQPGEQVIATAHPGSWMISGAMFWTLGLYSAWRSARWFMVTDRRVIMTAGLLVNRTSKSVPLQMIQDVQLVTRAGVGRIVLSTAGGRPGVQVLYPLSAQDARTLEAVILPRIGVRAGS